MKTTQVSQITRCTQDQSLKKNDLKTCKMRIQTLLDSAQPAIPNITAPSTAAQYTNQATVTHTMEEGKR